MFPTPESPAIREEGSTDMHHGDSVAAGRLAQHDDAKDAAWPASEFGGVLRIAAALRAAHLDDVEGRSPVAQEHEWNWIVKLPPRPPSASTAKEKLDREELLANDSLGG